MIEGWTSAPIPGAVLEAPLPVPHAATYRDGEIAVAAGRAEATVPDGAVGGRVAARAGIDAEGGAAVLATIEVREVFHALLLDTIELRYGWERCGTRPGTSWETC